MANIIKPKRSNTAAKVPTTTDLTSGELGVNMADKKVYINNGTAVVQVGAGNLSGLGDTSISSPVNGQSLIYNGTAWVNQAGAGTGDVVGPSSATDNAITRYDGTTGKLIQSSAATLDDNGNFSGVNGISFNTSPTSAPTSTGSMAWDNGDGTPYVVLNANTSLQLGQESIARVYNGTGSTIAKGSVVAVSGAQGQRPSVVLADADSEALSAPTLGIAAEAIANGAEGFVCTFGLVRGLNTSAFTAGAPIYLSSTAGAFTATKPVAPQHIVALGWVISVNASSGEVFVNINNGWELDELHNVLIASAASGNTLIYDAVAGVWENANLTAGTGISVTNGAGSITIANTGVTSVATGTGLTGGPITNTGTISLANTTVTAGSYTNANITVNAQGQITSASSGAGPFPSGTVMLFRQTSAPTGWTKDTTNFNDSALRVVTGAVSSGGTVGFTTAFASQSVSGTISSTTATNQNTTSTGSIGSTTATNQSYTPGGSVSVSVSGSVGSTTLSTTNIPSHGHTGGTKRIWDAAAGYYGSTGDIGTEAYVLARYTGAGPNYRLDYTSSTGGGGSHNHSFSGSGSGSFTGTAATITQNAHNHTLTMTAHTHTQDAHSHTFTGTAINMAVKYCDVIFATKD